LTPRKNKRNPVGDPSAKPYRRSPHLCHCVWTNSTLQVLAADLREQARVIQDDELLAVERRVPLLRAAAHLELAFAELAGVPFVPR